MDSCSERKRSGRASTAQLHYLAKFMKEHKNLAGGRVHNLYSVAETEKLWEDLAATLNSLDGPVKSVQKWRIAWKDLKIRTNNKLRGRGRTQSEKLEPSSDSTSETEKLCNSLIDKEFIEGSEMVAENVPKTEETPLRLEGGNDSNLDDDIPKYSNMNSDSTRVIENLHTPLIANECIEGSEMVAENVPETEELQLRLEGLNDCNLNNDIPKYTNTNQEYFNRTAQRTRKRKRQVEDVQAKFLRIAEGQANVLKLLAESSATNSEGMREMAQSITIMGQGLKRVAESVNNLAQAITRF